MTDADEYQRVLLDLSWPVEDAIEAAQALVADPGVRAAVEREALERAAQAIEEYGNGDWAYDDAARIVRDLMPRKDGEREGCGVCLACDPPSDRRFSRMYLCATCGNKRCPAAADCRKWECSGSNEPGQTPVPRKDGE